MAQVARHDARVNLAIPVPPIDNELWKKSATAIVFQANVLGVLNTIAISGYTSGVIANQATALGTDQVIINAAIVWVNALGGGSVFIEQGIYLLTASVLPLTNVFIYGAGPDTVLDGQNLAHAVDINNQDYVMIWNLSIQTTSGGGGLVNAVNIHGGCTFIKLDTVLIVQSDQDGVAITNADSEVWINDTAIRNVDRFGINNDGDNCRFFNNEIAGAVGNDGIFLDANSDGNYVLNNHIHIWTGEPIDDDGDNTVTGNICCVAGVAPIAWNSKGCGFATIQEAIDHQAGDGKITIEAGAFAVAAGVISLDAADNNLEIIGAGFLVTTLSSVAATGPCIDINGCINIRIAHLSVATTGAGANDAVQIRGACAAINLEDLACLDCGQDVVSIAAASSNVHIHACYFFAAITRYGINVEGDDCIISGNRINATGNDGIWIQAAAANTIVALNRISNWVGEAIDDDSGTSEVAHNVSV